MHRFDFEHNHKPYKALYRTRKGAIVDLEITSLSEPQRVITLDLLFPQGEDQTKFFRVLKIHSLKWGGC